MAQRLVLDSSPLIFIAKTRLQSLVGRLGLELITTPTVALEVLSQEHSETPVLKSMLASSIRVEAPKGAHASGTGLHAGEASAIALAAELHAVLASDDRVAIAVARTRGVTVIHTSRLILRALNRKLISAREAELLVKELIEAGWWCDAATLARITERIRGGKE